MAGRTAGGPPIWDVLDTDRDGILSADEIRSSPEALKRLDANGDDQVTPRELMRGRFGPRPGGRAEAQRPGPRPDRTAGDRPDRGSNRPDRERTRDRDGDGDGGPDRPAAPPAA
jgi:hypothetical protein